jgi:hypothetical protein
MLPLLRVLPVGGVFFAVLILIFALTPPDGATLALHRVAIDARGPLQDREDHPEWRQFFIQAALRRAEAVTKLRDLPSAPTKLPEIVMPVPPAPPIAITAAAMSGPSAQHIAAITPAADAAPAPKPAVAPDLAVAPAENAPARAIDHKPVAIVSLPVQIIEAPPITIMPATVQTLPSIPAADVLLPEASAGKTRIAVPLPIAAPTELRKVVGLPVERGMTDPAPEEVTGSVDALPGATIPIEIGETSSTELPIVLPPARPPVLRKLKRPITRAKHPAKPQPQRRKQMGLLDVWLARRQSAASQPAKPAKQTQAETEPQPQRQTEAGQ